MQDNETRDPLDFDGKESNPEKDDIKCEMVEERAHWPFWAKATCIAMIVLCVAFLLLYVFTIGPLGTGNRPQDVVVGESGYVVNYSDTESLYAAVANCQNDGLDAAKRLVDLYVTLDLNELEGSLSQLLPEMESCYSTWYGCKKAIVELRSGLADHTEEVEAGQYNGLQQRMTYALETLEGEVSGMTVDYVQKSLNNLMQDIEGIQQAADEMEG